MIAPHGQLRVYVATRPVDFRKGMDGLALAVQEMMGLDPFCGAAFVFHAKRADRIKILGQDGHGAGAQAPRERRFRVSESASRTSTPTASDTGSNSTPWSTDGIWRRR